MSQRTERSGRTRTVGEGTLFRLWIALLGVGLLVGLYGAVRLLLEGTVVLGIDSQLPWGILISTYEFFLLLSAGIMIGVVSIALVFGVTRFEPLVKRGVVLALATLAAGLFTIAIGLGRPERPAIQVLVSPNLSSPMWWVIVFAGAFGVALVVLLYLFERGGAESRRLTAAVGVVGLLAGVAVAVGAGSIFGFAETRPYYGGPLAPVYFVLTAVLSGVAAMGFVVVAEYKARAKEMSPELRELVTRYIGTSLGVLLGVTLLTVAVKAIYGLTATSESTAMAYEHMLFGSFAPLYWGLGILVGLVVPLFLVLYPGTRTLDDVMIASGMALVGLFVTRYEFVVGGQVVALVQDPSYEYPLVSYAPSLVEVSLVVFAVALVALVYTLGSRVLDLEAVPEQFEGTQRTRLNRPATPTRGDDDD